MMINTVLIVDDDAVIIKAIKNLFRKYSGIQILQASHVDQAKGICDTILLDMIICDYNLPGLKGDFLFHYLLSKGQKPIFILFTGSEYLIPIPMECPIYYQAVYNKDIRRLKMLIQSFETDQGLQL